MRPDPTKRWTLRRIFTFGAACAALITVGAIALGTAALLRLSEARVLLLDQVGAHQGPTRSRMATSSSSGPPL